MSNDAEEPAELLEDASELLLNLSQDLRDLYSFRDLFFENHPFEMASEKNKCVEEKKQKLVEKFENIDVDTQIPFSHRAEFLYLKGRCYNISSVYDPQAAQCLSKAVKLNPNLVSAWNELGECYLKNMNVKEAKNSFEGALKHERNRVALRCLSIILRQENTGSASEAKSAILASVVMAKEAVAQDTKDGISWTVLGNAYLCQFFMVKQDPATLKLCMSAYKQAWSDPIARGQPDLYYNKGVALKYEEQYNEALEMFRTAMQLDPGWAPAVRELTALKAHLAAATTLVRTRGRIKAKRLANMVRSIDQRMLGDYLPQNFQTFGNRKDVLLEHVTLDKLQDGSNENKVILGRVVGSIHHENCVPFTFALTDESTLCVLVSVYNWAEGRGPVVGDAVALPEPVLEHHQGTHDDLEYEFKSIRVNNPLYLLINGKRVNRCQFACTRVKSTYEIH
ncbi:tetratricopeptide repeat protein 5-like [Danaus plexippus]|uniref:tetratricopeptide repeat protein 5-like n=1 Tax=Danaus plexippus TaxID=13037 RepID=UPI002AB0CF5B|nr:tetratricopeptide repeat protein 5-like [Danaus plexippus]